jgi:hypothetical protein
MMTPFTYAEFYDVPRLIILLVREKWILLDSAFNEDVDEYEPEYSVYQLPSSFEPPTKGASWKFLEETERILLGKIPVQEVEFDTTKRQTLRAAALDALVPD